MLYIGIDPGNAQTGIAIYSQNTHSIVEGKILPNTELRAYFRSLEGPREGYRVGIESIASYGMAVGKSVFETAEWSGIIAMLAGSITDVPKRVYRKDVKHHLCGTHKAKDSNIRQSIIDQFPATGGGTNPQVGTLKKPGPLFGFSKDKWAALGVALTAAKTWDFLEPFPLPN
jgi:Holliday junction resolvasome RuvABC endonuclease subunit